MHFTINDRLAILGNEIATFKLVLDELTCWSKSAGKWFQDAETAHIS
jgi:hypothetical protein